MTATVASIDISRRPEDVFAYATDFAHFPEWVSAVESVRHENDDRAGLGSRAVVTRRVGPREISATEEITQLDPPRTWTVRGVSKPAVAIARGKVEPLDDGSRSRLTIALEFEGRGIGKLLVPLVLRPRARKQLAKDEQALKEVLERQP